MDVFLPWNNACHGLCCRYQVCEPLTLSCPSCSATFDCPAVFSSICIIGEKPTNMLQEESTYNFWRKLRCPKCPEEGDMGRISPGMIANQVFIEFLTRVLLFWLLAFGPFLITMYSWNCSSNRNISNIMAYLRPVWLNMTSGAQDGPGKIQGDNCFMKF